MIRHASSSSSRPCIRAMGTGVAARCLQPDEQRGIGTKLPTDARPEPIGPVGAAMRRSQRDATIDPARTTEFLDVDASHQSAEAVTNEIDSATANVSSPSMATARGGTISFSSVGPRFCPGRGLDSNRPGGRLDLPPVVFDVRCDPVGKATRFAYDIRDPRRWRRVHRIVKGYGGRLQFSVFECLLSEKAAVNRYFNGNYIRRMVQDHEQGRYNHLRHLYLLVSFELWHQRFLPS